MKSITTRFPLRDGGLLWKWELVQQFPVFRPFLYGPFETSDTEPDLSGGSEGGVF